MTLLLALLAQVGPFVTPGARPVSPMPPEIEERKDRRSSGTAPALAPLPPQAGQPAISEKLAQCLADARRDPVDAARFAQAWDQEAKGKERAEAGQCLGVAYSRMGRWDQAGQAFQAGRDAADPADHAQRARLGAMAGSAALASADAGAGLALLDTAHADAEAGGNAGLAGDIAIDRARALVQLGREEEADEALSEARRALPGNPQAWLFSAALSRRLGKLVEAQQQIERANELLPVDTEIGLEAGRIAFLGGRKEAARRSWQSVIDAAPESEAAAMARSYIVQLGDVGATTR